MTDIDQKFMLEALAQAQQAADLGDVPIGAVMVHDGEIIARGFNRRIIDKDPTAHAEMLVIRQTAEIIGDWRLNGCELYVTLEPCSMCAGAIVLARLDRVIYGATDPKAGAAGTLYNICSDDRLNHRTQVTSGILGEQCGQILTDFFRAQRAMGKK